MCTLSNREWRRVRLLFQYVLFTKLFPLVQQIWWRTIAEIVRYKPSQSFGSNSAPHSSYALEVVQYHKGRESTGPDSKIISLFGNMLARSVIRMLTFQFQPRPSSESFWWRALLKCSQTNWWLRCQVQCSTCDCVPVISWRWPRGLAVLLLLPFINVKEYFQVQCCDSVLMLLNSDSCTIMKLTTYIPTLSVDYASCSCCKLKVAKLPTYIHVLWYIDSIITLTPSYTYYSPVSPCCC